MGRFSEVAHVLPNLPLSPKFHSVLLYDCPFQQYWQILALIDYVSRVHEIEIRLWTYCMDMFGIFEILKIEILTIFFLFSLT